jgi:hypothetical protein
MEERLDDVSGEPGFRDLIGQQYELAGAVDAYGISLDYSSEHVMYIALIPPPGIAGPEVEFSVPLEPGSRVTILKVLRSNRFPDPDMTFEVRLEGTRMPVDVPVRVDLFRGNEGAGPVGLNPKIYRKARAP